MSKDFRAQQVRTNKIIGRSDGAIGGSGTNVQIAIMKSGSADFAGTITDPSAATPPDVGDLFLKKTSIGTDPWLVVDGASSNRYKRADGESVLFLGDVVVSGTLYAERQRISITTTSMNDQIDHSLVLSGSIFVNENEGLSVGKTAIISDQGIPGITDPRTGNLSSIDSVFWSGTDPQVDVNDANNPDPLLVIKPDVAHGGANKGVVGIGLDDPDAKLEILSTDTQLKLSYDGANASTFTVISDGSTTWEAPNAIINGTSGVDINGGTSGVLIDAVAGPVSIGTTYNNASAIDITTNGGSDEKILIKNTQGTTEAGASDGAIKLEATAGGITLDSALDIQLSADGGNVKMDDGQGVTVFDFDVDNTSFKIHDNSNSSDFFDIVVDTNGSTTLSTNDNNGLNGHLSLDADGWLNLGSSAAKWVFKNPESASTQSVFFFMQGSANDTQWTGFGDGATDAVANVFTFKNWRDANNTRPSVRMETVHKLEFRDSDISVHSSVDGQLDIDADVEIEITAPTVDINASSEVNISNDLVVGGNLTVNGTTTTLDTTNLTVEDPVILMASGASASNQNGGIVLEQGGSAADSDLVIGRVANDTWGFGLKDTSGGTSTDLSDMTLTTIRAQKLEIQDSTEYITGDGTDITIASGGDINLTTLGDVNIPASVGLTFGADTNKVEVDGSNNMTVITANDMTFQTGGADADQFLFRNGTDTTEETKLCIGDTSTFIERQGGSNNVNFTSNRPITVSAGGALNLYGSAANFKTQAGTLPVFNVSRRYDGISYLETVLLANHTNDIVFQTAPGGTATEIARFDTSEASLLMPTANKIQFREATNFVNSSASNTLDIEAGSSDNGTINIGTDEASTITIGKSGVTSTTIYGLTLASVNVGPNDTGAITFLGTGTDPAVSRDASSNLIFSDASNASVTLSDLAAGSVDNSAISSAGGSGSDRNSLASTYRLALIGSGSVGGTYPDELYSHNGLNDPSDIMFFVSGTIAPDINSPTAAVRSNYDSNTGGERRRSILSSDSALLGEAYIRGKYTIDGDGNVDMSSVPTTFVMTVGQKDDEGYVDLDGKISFKSANAAIIASAGNDIEVQNSGGTVKATLDPNNNNVTLASGVKLGFANSSNSFISGDGTDIDIQTPGSVSLKNTSGTPNIEFRRQDSTITVGEPFGKMSFWGSENSGVNWAETGNIAIEAAASFELGITQRSRFVVNLTDGTTLEEGMLISHPSSNIRTDVLILGRDDTDDIAIQPQDRLGSNDLAAKDLIIRGGRGTGIGDPGSIKLRVAYPLGSSGSGNQTWSDSLIIDHTEITTSNNLVPNADSTLTLGKNGRNYLDVYTDNISFDSTSRHSVPNVASDTLALLAAAQTLTNKTIDADSNTLSNIEVDNFKASSIVTEAEGISSNDNDTTLPTSAAVKDYVDSQVTAQDLDFQADSGGALSIDLDSETMTFTGGTGIDTSGAGNAVTFSIDSTVATLTGTQTLTNKTLNDPILSDPKISTIVHTGFANDLLSFTVEGGGSTNHINIYGALTTNAPKISSVGVDTNIDLILAAKGTGVIEVESSIIPDTNNSYDLGSSTNRFANIYTNDLNLCNEGRGNDVDGTSGNWTIQEGEDSLYVINNITGKKYKMMLQPVDGEI